MELVCEWAVDVREHGTGGVVAGETGLAHTRTIVNDKLLG
mgnify:FL=1